MIGRRFDEEQILRTDIESQALDLPRVQRLLIPAVTQLDIAAADKAAIGHPVRIEYGRLTGVGSESQLLYRRILIRRRPRIQLGLLRIAIARPVFGRKEESLRNASPLRILQVHQQVEIIIPEIVDKAAIPVG